MSEAALIVEEMRERYLDTRGPGLHEPTPGFVAPTLDELVAAQSEDLLLPEEGMVGAEAFRAAHAWIRLRPGPNHDPGSGSYVERYPTRYFFTPGVRRLAEKYINMPAFRGKVWANTYRWHPPKYEDRYEHVSVDFWAWAGRGHTLRDDLQRPLESVIMNDPDPPNILWIWSNGRIWQPPGPWEATNEPEMAPTPTIIGTFTLPTIGRHDSRGEGLRAELEGVFLGSRAHREREQSSPLNKRPRRLAMPRPSSCLRNHSNFGEFSFHALG